MSVMCVFKRIRWTWNLELEKKDIAMVKNGRCKFVNENCG